MAQTRKLRRMWLGLEIVVASLPPLVGGTVVPKDLSEGGRGVRVYCMVPWFGTNCFLSDIRISVSLFSVKSQY